MKQYDNNSDNQSSIETHTDLIKDFDQAFQDYDFDFDFIESNLYATQHNANLNTNVEEIKAFIGMLIYMGYHSLPSIRFYWSTDQNFYCERIAKIMPVKRFLKLLRYLHLNNNLNMPQRDSLNFDKLYKIHPLISHLQDKYLSIFKPSRHVAVDESMDAI
ncbi:piggyBac transposable element-derived protein 4-like [Acyrthosiphon pisum]|uniref:PiggyBac transposable element-derived protein domain-containing protein n=1 Tax=Acyrthosiphon pisum TaxID=7029 RepID=A0A8R2F6R0_ACYPI|nr:piggyBac transposable element-derived protein 4-like [Acyrthosiphon pisum]|eukprot:XP_008181184.1 PREDICTED: piggyBac transposable element-derived protein 4-like [Acyrthosiphon pisum]